MEMKIVETIQTKLIVQVCVSDWCVSVSVSDWLIKLILYRCSLTRLQFVWPLKSTKLQMEIFLA